MHRSSPKTESHWPHRLAWAMSLVTFPVIWMGGLVTTYEAGMAVPDWPSTYGYNLFLYPWQTWLGGPWDLFVEHGHRLLAATVGVLTIGLVVSLWRSESRSWVRFLGLAALAGVLLQGGLGGLRVLLDERLLARIHACVGPAFFALAVGLVVMTSGRWRGAASPLAWTGAGKFQRLALITALLAYLQIVVGAHLRHQSLFASPSSFRVTVIFHLLLALALAIHAAILVFKAVRLPAETTSVRQCAQLLGCLVLLQLGLGLGTWIVNYGWPAGVESYALAASHTIRAQSQMQTVITTVHVALGSLILATSVALVFNAFRWMVRDDHRTAAIAKQGGVGFHASDMVGLLRAGAAR